MFVPKVQGVKTRKSRLCRKFKSTKLICFTTFKEQVNRCYWLLDLTLIVRGWSAMINSSKHYQTIRLWTIEELGKVARSSASNGGGCRSTARLFRHSPGACSRSFRGVDCPRLASYTRENVRSLIWPYRPWQREIVSFRHWLSYLVSLLWN